MKQTLLIMAQGAASRAVQDPAVPTLLLAVSDGALSLLSSGHARQRPQRIPETAATIIVTYPQGDEEAMRSLLPPGVRLREQPKGDLGARLNGLFVEYLFDADTRVVIIGTDSPTMPSAFLHEAFAALDTHDVALGAARDGGYYAIGLKQPAPRLFTAIDWSTDRVHAQTLERAKELNLRVHDLPLWYDVDRAADLHQLGRAIVGGADAPQTAAFLRQLSMGASGVSMGVER